jgi:hypothetical protein
MNPFIQDKNIHLSLLIGYIVVCFGALPKAHAVVPPPDGGYPGGNTAEGQSALLNLTTGGFNTAVGFVSLRSDTTGSFNTGVGAGTLFANNADNNTATGAAALLSNTTGEENTANGAFALFSNAQGSFNSATGFRALFSNTTGAENTATGAFALSSNTTGNGNTANGAFTLVANTGDSNTATGNNALSSNTTGSANTATGIGALFSNDTGNNNTATGENALFGNTIGTSNTAIGTGALSGNSTGSANIALGVDAGNNIFTANNVIAIGTSGADVSNSCYIGRIFGATSTSGTAVFINSDGKLGTTTSSKRFKEDIKPMDKTSETILALKPVTFRYKKEIDPASTSQCGLVAEEVEKINPDLIVRDKEGKPYSVRYDQVNAMLLNEFLREHRKVQKLEAAVAQQQKDFETSATKQREQIQALTARLDAQAAQIQKVSAQVELSRPATKVADDNH